MDDNEILRRAQALMIDRKYQQARSLLEVLDDNPQALRWIAKIDEIKAREEVATLTPKPFVSSDQSPFVKEKPKRSPIRRAMRELFILLIAFLVCSFVIIRWEHLKYDVLTLVGATQTHQGQRMIVSHPATLESTPLAKHSWCRDTEYPETTCLHYLKRYPENDKGLLFLHVSLDDYYSSREFLDFNWTDGDSTFVRQNRQLQDVTVAGIPGVTQFYRQLEKDEDSGDFYIAEIYLTNGLDGYVISTFTTNQCEMVKYLGEINSILSTLQLATQGESEKVTNFSAASPVSLELEACA